MDKKKDQLDQLCRRAVACRLCFKEGLVRSALIDMAQPRWVGPNYFNSAPRVLLMLLNPGSGRGYADKTNSEYLKQLGGYRQGSISLDDLFERQKADMRNWRRKFIRFYIDGLELDLANIAFANIAWCASEDNKYPREMLSKCFNRHTAELIDILKPNILISSGGDTQEFLKRYTTVPVEVEVHPLLHNAHRVGREREAFQLTRVKDAIHRWEVAPNQALEPMRNHE